MTAEDVLAALVRVNVVASLAILLVLALRPLVLRRLGAQAAYRLWLVVPIAAAACLLPAREIAAPAPPALVVTDAGWDADADATEGPASSPSAPSEVASAPPPQRLSWEGLALAIWLVGAAGLLLRSIASTRRLARDPSIGPALVGVLRPRLLLPEDFETRFDAQERALILAHEDVHRASGHTVVNALIELARCASWFNPLAHLAAVRIRTDQELACDAAVVATHPTERRAYAEALLKTQIAPAYLPLGCTWPSRSSARLKERIAMLSHPSPRRWAGLAGAASIALLGVGSGFAAWAQQPPRVARPDAVWTSSAEAPSGLLTPIEVMRHDLFIDLARNAASCPGSPREACRDGEGIDIVFFGTTDTEMFWWPDRGMEVWRQAFGSRKAVNFGSQGTNPESLLWRMQNGELDGYQAKVVVLQAFGPADAAIREDERAALVAGYAAILAEIRARQPQAKILIQAALPRGRATLEAWRQASAANAAALADDETVFYVDFGERFFDPDGSFRGEMWSTAPGAIGRQTPAYEAWVEGLEPWLDRFVG